MSKKLTAGLISFFGLVALCTTTTPAAEPSLPMPAIIQKGLDLYKRGGVGIAFDAWQSGGAIEGDSSVAAKSRAFKDMTGLVGDYKSSEVIQLKEITRTSRIVYVAMNFKRGAIYARFLLYHAENDWVVQDMTFSIRPEAVMPWLALESETAQ
ncbi:MAG TPA: hypothetical protein VGR78_18875 [Verrucomicrobiae bacterium]|jgi:hypothetical protein|nr:hypothetical protein [Verrucomicrobiae bacterium]